MALKKADEKELTPAEIEAKRAAEAQAQVDADAKEKADKEAAQKEADDKAAKELADKEAADKAAADKEISDKEADRLAREKALADQEAASTAERLAQEAEATAASGKQPRERKLVEVESKTFSDLRQPSTGTWITGKGVAFLLDDGWLENQINSKLLNTHRSKPCTLT